MHKISNRACKVVAKEQMLNRHNLTLHCQFLLAKLSFVTVTPFFRCHKTILILSGIFNFPRGLLPEGTPSWIKFECMYKTMNMQFLVRFHRKISFTSFDTRSSQTILFVLTKPRLKDTLSGTDPRMFATSLYLRLTVLKKIRVNLARGFFA